MDCSLPGSSVHWIFQARVLEWGAIAFSKGTPINLQVRSTNCAKLWSGRRGGEDKTSRPNPSPGDVSPGAESHILGNDLGQHRAQGTHLVGATVFLTRLGHFVVAKREIVFSGPDSGVCVCVCGVYFPVYVYTY